MKKQTLTRPAIFACFALGLALQAPAQNLPDAPPPPPQGPVPPTPDTHVAVPATRPPDVESLNHRQWSGVVEPGEKIPPLTVRDKLLFPLHEELQPVTTIAPDLWSGVYGIARDSDPKVGTDSAGFGERVGYAAARQVISRELCDGYLPILFHEDPRYYRQAYGTYGSRIHHAIRRVFLTQTDSGAKTFNYSDFVGRGMNAALTQTYYPQNSIGTGVVLRTWGLSLLGLAGGNLYSEFLPDLKRKVLHEDR